MCPNKPIRAGGIMLHRIICHAVMVIGLVVAGTAPAFAWTAEELAETFCDYYDGVGCHFEDRHATYKFGPYSALHHGNGKIRSEAAYCLLRDGNGQAVNATLGEDWYRFGTEERLHITYAGQAPTGFYRAEGQRIMDLVLFGHTLHGAEVQDYLADFPTELERPKKPACLQWTQIGKKKWCVRYAPALSLRTGYYMTLDTFAYGWDVDVDEVVRDLSAVFGGPPIPDELQLSLGQEVPFVYYGTTELGGNELILDDGLIPAAAFSGNEWAWGLPPDAVDPSSAHLSADLPIVSVKFASLMLYLDVTLNNEYQLREGPFITDPDTGLMDNPPNPEALTTSTHLAAESDLDLVLEACLDFGWFGEWCSDFAIVDAEHIAQADPLNIITYTPRGTPLSVQWADGVTAAGTRDAADHLNACLFAAPVIDEPEEMAAPGDWVEFLNDVAASVDEHFEPCFIVEPVNTVQFQEPSFKLCDDAGHVYEAVDGIRKKPEATSSPRRRGQ